MLKKIQDKFIYNNENIFRNRLVLAPMAGINDAPFRKMIWKNDCGILFSGMISCSALVDGNKNTLRILKSCITEDPTIIQIYGSKPHLMKKAAIICQNHGASMLDINMGCPKQKIFKKGSGAALMLNHDKCREVIRQVRDATKLPLSIKIRTGEDEQKIEAFEVAKIAEEESIDMITVHPRTRKQMFTGRSNWKIIRDIKKAVKIPVIGNGDVTNMKQAKKMLTETDCDLIMIGRASIGQPWIFAEIVNNVSFNLQEKFIQIIDHLDEMIICFGEELGTLLFRKHLVWYARGFKDATHLRTRLTQSSKKKEIIEILSPHYV